MLDLYDEFHKLVGLLEEHEIDEGGKLSVVSQSGLISLKLLRAGRILTTSNHYKRKVLMPKVDMSSRAITTRLKRVSQLRRLCLSLGAAKINVIAAEKGAKRETGVVARPNKREAK